MKMMNIFYMPKERIFTFVKYLLSGTIMCLLLFAILFPNNFLNFQSNFVDACVSFPSKIVGLVEMILSMNELYFRLIVLGSIITNFILTLTWKYSSSSEIVSLSPILPSYQKDKLEENNIEDESEVEDEGEVEDEKSVVSLTESNIKKHKYERRGEKWTEDEENKLLDEFSKHKSIEDIAVEHKRSKFAIEMRQTYIAKKLNKNGISPSDIASRLNLSEEQVCNRIS